LVPLRIHVMDKDKGTWLGLQFDEIAASITKPRWIYDVKLKRPRSSTRNRTVICLRTTHLNQPTQMYIFGRTVIGLVLTVALAPLSTAMPQEFPEGEGKKLLEERCASCHSLKPVFNLKQNQDAWKKLVVKMVGYGAHLDGKEVDVATAYLTKHFGPESSPAAKPDSPEEKIAKRYIEGICSSCHDAGLIRSTEATKEGWLDIVTRMNGLDAGVSQRDVDLLVDYLASKYGPK
jgi:cytochrome c5